LSSSRDEIGRARGALHAKAPTGVLDELGFLVLQTAFANRLYPATNTVMTRARYLVFVPAIYRYIEETGKGVGKDVDEISRDLQHALRDALLANESTGVIGKEKGRDLVRPASNIYWYALVELGLATQDVSEYAYQDRLSRGEMGQHIVEDDDRAKHVEEIETLWHPGVRPRDVMPDGRFPARTSFRLAKHEALLLEARYRALGPASEGSLLAHLIDLGKRRRPEVLDAVAAPWDAPEVPEPLAAIAEHARRLSLFARGVRLQYEFMLIEARKLDDPGAAQTFSSWWAAARGDLASWDLDAFFTLVRRWGAERQSLDDRRFIGGWIQRSFALPTAGAALADAVAQKYVRERERRARPQKERLKPGHYRDEWEAPERYDPEERYALSYRHRIGRQVARDIVEGLESRS
jgi:hypothetical protein